MGTHSPEKWNIQLWPDSDVLAEKIKIGKIPALAFVRNLQEAGVEAEADVWHSDTHAFDMLFPDRPESIEAKRKFEEAFAYAAEHYFAEN